MWGKGGERLQNAECAAGKSPESIPRNVSLLVFGNISCIAIHQKSPQQGPKKCPPPRDTGEDRHKETGAQNMVPRNVVARVGVRTQAAVGQGGAGVGQGGSGSYEWGMGPVNQNCWGFVVDMDPGLGGYLSF